MPSPETSPDQAWTTRVEKDRIVLIRREGGAETVLRAPLPEKATYRGKVSWSPDSKAFLVSAAVEVTERVVTIVDSSPSDQKQPKVKSFPYAKPGDPLPKPQLVLFRPGSEEGRVIDPTLFPNPFTQSHEIRVTWAPDGGEAYFDYNERGHQCYRILAVNAATGAVRVVVEETAKTFIDYTKKTWRHWFHGRGELLWMSERSGWAHLYLHDIASGELRNAVTSGAWPVREVLHVDAEKRQVWFLASGSREGEDPYHLHLCRANLDGSGFVRLTEGDGNHHIEFSPGREWFIDRWSRADHPPVHELRRSGDGTLVCELERADASALLAGGWTMPERFVAKGRDGKTDIHGILVKPSSFDPAKSYPVIEDVYAGPHAAFAPKDFGRLERLHGIANEGFILVKLDGMGTNFRGKAFHDVAWKNLKDSGFPDRIAWIREAAKTGPGWISPASGSTEAVPEVRARCARSSITTISTRSPWPIAGATTTAWTRSGGTSSGWAGRWMRATRRIRMPTMPTNWAANFSSSSGNSTTTSIPPAPPRSSRPSRRLGRSLNTCPSSEPVTAQRRRPLGRRRGWSF